MDDDLKKLNEFSYVDGFDLIYDALLNLRDNEQFIGMGGFRKQALIRKAANGSLKRIRFLLLKLQRMECTIFHFFISLP